MNEEQKERARENLAKAREAKRARQDEKKGNPTWKPAKRLETIDKVFGYRYRWVNKEDSQNLQRKLVEGWVHATKENGLAASHIRPAGVEDGAPLDSTTTYRELTLMALPEDLAQARDEFIEAETKKQTAGRARRLQQEVREAAQGGTAAEVHQKIEIIT